MANMSYCRFENTYRDLQDCFHNMDDDSSESESIYRKKLIELCDTIAREFSYLLEEEDDD